ncbi:HRDC domain-containing protein [Roseospira visakhapatnamensis]|uniref:Superfamily II DNA helicase RecQ n=1 Tax=Roseospira visakhapatnamensis TaxID=390880 RepID=A0A7W6RGP3_9PROT|nr:HRDC domain-containing protein [Roseospira visakhapatnamensis]MBB4268005.1 superfamily II DNA helicase RecQ [Roseospira visakhapatnamensis]
MRLRFFTIPAHGGDDAAEALNRFLAGHRVVAVDRSFIQDGRNSAWAVCVTIENGPAPQATAAKKPRVDYREVLNEQDFAVFARLRAVRKDLAEAEGIPAYAIFTNEQLADMVRRKVRSAGALREIDGVGEARVDKYAGSFLDVLRVDTDGSSQEDPS